MSLPAWFQGEIPIELLRLARVNSQEPAHRQILAEWMERYGGEEGQLLCRFLRRDVSLRHDASTWMTLSASEARLVSPFSDLVLGIGDRVVLPLTKKQTITMGWVPSGESWLGGGGGKRGKKAFTAEKGLWCGIYPVTQEQWQMVMGNNPSRFQGKPQNPVENMPLSDVKKFLRKLNASNSRNGVKYRLPRSDEWEYILRGGPIVKNQSQYDYYFARSKTDLTAVPSNDFSSTQANCNGSFPESPDNKDPYLETTSAVGSYLPNPLGMYDMHGNVSEWSFSKEEKLPRLCGGCHFSVKAECGASHSYYSTSHNDPINDDYSIGCRILADL